MSNVIYLRKTPYKRALGALPLSSTLQDKKWKSCFFKFSIMLKMLLLFDKYREKNIKIYASVYTKKEKTYGIFKKTLTIYTANGVQFAYIKKEKLFRKCYIAKSDNLLHHEINATLPPSQRVYK